MRSLRVVSLLSAVAVASSSILMMASSSSASSPSLPLLFQGANAEALSYPSADTCAGGASPTGTGADLMTINCTGPAPFFSGCPFADGTIINVDHSTTTSSGEGGAKTLTISGGSARGAVTINLGAPTVSFTFILEDGFKSMRNRVQVTGTFSGRDANNNPISQTIIVRGCHFYGSSDDSTPDGVRNLQSLLHFTQFELFGGSTMEISNNYFEFNSVRQTLALPQSKGSSILVESNFFNCTQRGILITSAVYLSAYTFESTQWWFFNTRLTARKNTFIANGNLIDGEGTPTAFDFRVQSQNFGVDMNAVDWKSVSDATAKETYGKNVFDITDNTVVDMANLLVLSSGDGLDLKFSNNRGNSSRITLANSINIQGPFFSYDVEIKKNNFAALAEGLHAGVGFGCPLLPEKSTVSISDNTFTTGTVNSLFFPIALISTSFLPKSSTLMISSNTLLPFPTASPAVTGRTPRVFMVGYTVGVASTMEGYNTTSPVTVCNNKIFGDTFCTLEQAKSIVYAIAAVSPLHVDVAKCCASCCGSCGGGGSGGCPPLFPSAAPAQLASSQQAIVAAAVVSVFVSFLVILMTSTGAH